MSGIYIKEVKIENFKCFAEQSIGFSTPDGSTPGSGLNVLIGENGNGKTTILEALNFTNQSSFASENKLSVNDFYDSGKPIAINTLTNDFVCKMTAPYMGCTFESEGFAFKAKNRDRKSSGKLLSSPFSINTNFRTKKDTYNKKDGSDSGKEIPALNKIYSNGVIQDSELNIFYFDKNRTRQISSGTYKTTFERVCDDLNWKFLKNIQYDDVQALIDNMAGQYFEKSISIAQKGTGQKLAKEMAEFFGNDDFLNLKIELLDLLHPFSKAFFAIRQENSLTQVSPKDLGSGVEIILTLLLLKSIASESKGGIVYLIDEPELHLHPLAQQRLAELLIAEAENVQIVVSTHSPYLIRSFMGENINKIILKRDDSQNIVLEKANSISNCLFPWSPSWGEVNFNAYGMATVEFHNELYGWLQEKHSLPYENNVESHLSSSGVQKSKQWTKEKNGNVQAPYDITLCSYVRNSIHHPENSHNLKYTEQELVESINVLISSVT